MKRKLKDHKRITLQSKLSLGIQIKSPPVAGAEPKTHEKSLGLIESETHLISSKRKEKQQQILSFHSLN